MKNYTDVTFHSPSLPFCLSLGVEAKLDNINQLKVKGLVLGPLHTVQADQPHTLNLEEINLIHGTKEDLVIVIEKAQRKGTLSTEIVYLGVRTQISTNVGFTFT